MSDRRFPSRPLVGVGAIVFSPDLGHVLLVRRGTPPAEGQWTFPGGLVERETARLACLRELREETGIDAELRDVAFVAERVVHDATGRVEYHYVILDFWGIATERRVPEARSDARAAEWVRVDELGARPTTRGVADAVNRALQLARGQPPTVPTYSD
jgi:ADP-ribose pyrophosphatase YjhB (NUDIX family)